MVGRTIASIHDLGSIFVSYRLPTILHVYMYYTYVYCMYVQIALIILLQPTLLGLNVQTVAYS